jgi:hypothetical protein
MFMLFRGGGVGHGGIRNYLEDLRKDRDSLDQIRHWPIAAGQEEAHHLEDLDEGTEDEEMANDSDDEAMNRDEEEEDGERDDDGEGDDDEEEDDDRERDDDGEGDDEDGDGEVEGDKDISNEDIWLGYDLY